jgi:hypothetical protein
MVKELWDFSSSWSPASLSALPSWLGSLSLLEWQLPSLSRMQMRMQKALELESM